MSGWTGPQRINRRLYDVGGVGCWLLHVPMYGVLYLRQCRQLTAIAAQLEKAIEVTPPLYHHLRLLLRKSCATCPQTTNLQRFSLAHLIPT